MWSPPCVHVTQSPQPGAPCKRPCDTVPTTCVPTTWCSMYSPHNPVHSPQPVLHVHSPQPGAHVTVPQPLHVSPQPAHVTQSHNLVLHVIQSLQPCAPCVTVPTTWCSIPHNLVLHVTQSPQPCAPCDTVPTTWCSINRSSYYLVLLFTAPMMSSLLAVSLALLVYTRVSLTETPPSGPDAPPFSHSPAPDITSYLFISSPNNHRKSLLVLNGSYSAIMSTCLGPTRDPPGDFTDLSRTPRDCLGPPRTLQTPTATPPVSSRHIDPSSTPRITPTPLDPLRHTPGPHRTLSTPSTQDHTNAPGTLRHIPGPHRIPQHPLWFPSTPQDPSDTPSGATRDQPVFTTSSIPKELNTQVTGPITYTKTGVNESVGKSPLVRVLG
ncbi:mucin-2-like [Homarus americanus]|uniref:mucin-2-like n=1 Tax=Homarus americanus TaxID=6706 RepID=UPI001C473FE9|nr:mucin-2-like [Homarus americanus]